MRRFNSLTLFVASLILILGYSIGTWGVKAKSIRVHARDLREHGLLIISPTDPSFEGEVARLTANKSDEQKRLIEALEPFSVFVRNTGARDVIAYRIRWEVLRPDGTVITHLRTYADPGLLLGRYEFSEQEAARNSGFSIRAKSDRYVSIESSISSSSDSPELMSMGGIGASEGDVERVRQMGQDRNVAALTEMLGAQLAQSESLTVSLDAAVFADGTFVGPDLSGYFAELQAEVNAQQYLLQQTLLATQQKRPWGQIFGDLEAITKEPSVAIREGATPDEYYKYYRKEFAEEILRVRAATGDDKQAIWRAIQPLRKSKPKLHKKL